MRKRAAVVAVWIIGTLASIGLAWTAVSAVSGQVTSPPSGGLTSAEVAEAAALPVTSTATTAATPGSGPPASAPSTTPTPTTSVPPATAPPVTSPPPSPPTTSAPPAPEPASTRTFELVGGSAGLRCAADRVSLTFATPRAGYAAEVHDPGPGKLDVRFDNGELESRLVVTCSAGTADAEIRED